MKKEKYVLVAKNYDGEVYQIIKGDKKICTNKKVEIECKNLYGKKRILLEIIKLKEVN